MNNSNLFGNNLKYLRLSKKMNQAEISAAIGFKRNTWSNYETGVSKPSYNDLMKIVEYFDISLDKLTSLDLQISHLNKNLGVPKKQDISHLNTHLNTHLNEEDKPYLAVAEDPVAYSSGQNRVVTELLRPINHYLQQLRL